MDTKLFRPALSGGMDWWRMGMTICQRPKNIFQRPKFAANPGNTGERAIFATFHAPKFENSEPEKIQFHTPSHAIPPLNSLLLFGIVPDNPCNLANTELCIHSM